MKSQEISKTNLEKNYSNLIAALTESIQFEDMKDLTTKEICLLSRADLRGYAEFLERDLRHLLSHLQCFLQMEHHLPQKVGFEATLLMRGLEYFVEN